ncbi:MAG: hypothetical protein J6X18_01660 [Bacteroidales bacterium]|nr:hypothetical protein [Bacteroidales bacterium]
MGNGADFFARDAAGRQSEYDSLSPAVTVNGIKGHLIKRKGDSDTHTNLPFYANTSDVYFKISDVTCQIEQARFYSNRRAVMDFDWGHPHGKNNEFPEGVVHVQAFNYDSKTKKLRTASTRLMTNEEIAKFGDILKKVNPNIKFR